MTVANPISNADVKAAVGDTPHMTLEQADRLTAFLEDNHLESLLELGWKHGVSTCYMAASLARTGGGHITTIDLTVREQFPPTIETLLDRVGLRDLVTIYAEPTSYTWRLMKLLEEDPTPRFDFCYVDGAHNWFVDGFAFFLVDKLLVPGGWIVFDDLNWSYNDSPTLRNSEQARSMPPDERTIAQVRKVYDLLVRTHPSYHNFRIEGDWAFAQKRLSNAAVEREIVVERVTDTRIVSVGLGALALRGLRKLRGRPQHLHIP